MNGKVTGLRCPRCKDLNTIDYGEMIECPSCHLHFFKKHLGKIKDEDVLAIEGLDGFYDSS